MPTTTPAIQDLARRLIALEAARDDRPVAAGNAAGRVCEKLRVPLVRLAGVAGFRSLLSRALAIAKAEVPSLDAVRVRSDGSIEGLDTIGGTLDAEPEVALVAELLGLLVTFIAEPLTLSLVGEAWPDTPVADFDAGRGEAS